jgi:hypothetical protein
MRPLAGGGRAAIRRRDDVAAQHGMRVLVRVLEANG